MRPALLLAALAATMVITYLVGFFAYHSLTPQPPAQEVSAANGAHTFLSILFAPGPLPWLLVIAGTMLALGAAGADLWRHRRANRAVDTERRLVQRELVHALDEAATPERAFYGYTFLQGEFQHDPAMQAELRRAFRPEWLPQLRRQLGRHLRAGEVAEALAFLAEMEWEWRESAGKTSLAAVRTLLQHLRQPRTRPGQEALAEILEGFRAAGLGVAEVVLAWLASTEPDPEVVREMFFRTGGAGGRYLLRRWAERDSQVQARLRAWESSSAPAYRRQTGSCPLWPRERGESSVIQRGVARLELDLNPFGPEKAEQDPLLPDLFYPLSPAWDEVMAPQPGIVVAPAGCGRSALLWMLRHESGLASTALEQVLPAYVPLHDFRSMGEVFRALHDALLEAWSCTLARDPYGLLGLAETDQQTVAGLLVRAAGGLSPLLERLKGAGLPPGDPDGQILKEILTAAAGTQSQDRGTGPDVGPREEAVDLAAVGRLVRNAFTPGELRRFCQERSAFRPVLDEWGAVGLNEMTYVLIEYCEKRALFAELLAEIATANPRQYKRYRPQLGTALPPEAGWSARGNTIPEIPHGWLSLPYGITHIFLLLDVACQNRGAVAMLVEFLFGRWLPWLSPRHFVPKLFVGFEPQGCPLPPIHVRWDRKGLDTLLRHRLQRAGLVVQKSQPALQGWVEDMEDPDAALVEAAGHSPARLMRLGNRLIRRMAEPQALGRDEFVRAILECDGEDRPPL